MLQSDDDSNNEHTTYRDRISELRKLKSSVGEIVVVDSLSGYGKTAFLQEVYRHYNNDGWLVRCIVLSDQTRQQDILIQLLRELDNGNTSQPSGLDGFLRELSFSAYSSQLRDRSVAVLFDDIHTLSNDTLKWLTQVFASRFLSELQDISRSDDRFLLVFSGNNIAHSLLTTWPLDRKSIYLRPFDRNTIQEFIDAVPNERFQSFLLRDPRYRKWLTEKLIRLCGGHPRALLNILKEIERGDWQPNPRHDESKEFYQNIFERYVLGELNKLTDGLSRGYCQLLESLCIYRSVNSGTVKVVQQDRVIDNNESPLKIVTKLRHHKLYLAKERILDPVVRNGLTTRLMMKDHQRYVELNRTALEFYKEQLAQFDESKQPFESAQSFASEAIYHCLCHSREVQDLKNCLSFTTRPDRETQRLEGIKNSLHRS